MNIAQLSIKRPIFITCIVLMILALGFLAFKKLPVDLFPNVTFPVVVVNTPYPGAGPAEVETLISKVFENQLSTLPGIKSVSSISKEGLSTVVAEFTLETDVKYAEQLIRNRVSIAKTKLPKDVKEPIINRLDPADQPVIVLALAANLSESELFELANERVKPKVEQVNKVGLVEIIGGRKREVLVELDRNKLKSHELSASRVASALASAGQNIPAGKVSRADKEINMRSLGEFKSLDDIGSTIVSFVGNDNPVRIKDVGEVKDSMEDEKSRAFINGQKSIFLYIYRQSGSNTIAVVDAIKKRVEKLNQEIKDEPSHPHITFIRDGSLKIHANVDDVKESIMLGIVLTIVVVYLFLGNASSTIITALALPNSLIGAFMLMSAFGFSINIMTLLALSLSVGLLIDDAIVVRENIFRHLEMGKSALQAAQEATSEVLIAVIATTLTVIAVFGPIAFLHGIVGQFFKEFGLTICFIMLISLFDALTVAPMLSAYLAGRVIDEKYRRYFKYLAILALLGHFIYLSLCEYWGQLAYHTYITTLGWHALLAVLIVAALYGMGYGARAFGRLQDKLENAYERLMGFALRHPLVIIFIALGIFICSFVAAKYVPKTFLPGQDFGEFLVATEMPPGTSLDAMQDVAQLIEVSLRKHSEVASTVLTVGSNDGEANVAEVYVTLTDAHKRKLNTTQFKDLLRQELKSYAYAKPIVKDVDIVGGGQRPFNLNIVGPDLDQLQGVANQVFERLKKHPALQDPELSFKAGKPEFQIAPDHQKAQALGISSAALGYELRTQVEGTVPAVYREHDLEYDIRVRLREDQRDLKQSFYQSYVPNINQTLIHLSDVARPIETTGPANITRKDRGRYIQIAADIAPKGPGIGGVMTDINKLFKNDIKLPPGVHYEFVGQAENFQELIQNMLIAAGLGMLFIYFVLSSLYESFITPFTIMLVLPLAICGAFYALCITQHSLDIFSMIGCIMLLGIATKNSILLVDFTHQLIEQGLDEKAALLKAGRARLRPILMTTCALIAGMLPIAIGLNEASRQRTSMGIAIIGGLISSTLLTLVVVPATFGYIERFRRFCSRVLTRVFVAEHSVQ